MAAWRGDMRPRIERIVIAVLCALLAALVGNHLYRTLILREPFEYHGPILP